MIILEKCFRGATIADHLNRRFLVKQTFIRKRTPHRISYLLDGKEVPKNKVLQPIEKNHKSCC